MPDYQFLEDVNLQDPAAQPAHDNTTTKEDTNV